MSAIIVLIVVQLASAQERSTALLPDGSLMPREGSGLMRRAEFAARGSQERRFGAGAKRRETIESMHAQLEVNEQRIADLEGRAREQSASLFERDSSDSDLAKRVERLESLLRDSTSTTPSLTDIIKVNAATKTLEIQDYNLRIFASSNNGGTGQSTYVGNLLVGSTNRALGTNSFVAGSSNKIYGDSQAVCGGYSNRAGTPAGDTLTCDTSPCQLSAVCGGSANTATGSYSHVGGGNTNIASGTYSSISGGYNNRASGESSAIGGGSTLTATSQFAFSPVKADVASTGGR